MASIRNREFRGYCDRMYEELSGMKDRLLGFVSEIEGMQGPGKDTLATHIPHFLDIARTIEWKLEILTRVCPYDWAGYSEVEKNASVRVDETLMKEDFIGAGSVGG